MKDDQSLIWPSTTPLNISLDKMESQRCSGRLLSLRRIAVGLKLFLPLELVEISCQFM